MAKGVYNHYKIRGKKKSPFTKEHKKHLCWKINDLRRKKHPKTDTHCSQKTKDKISKGNRGKVISEKTRKKLSIWMKAHPQESWFKSGISLSDNIKRKISRTLKKNYIDKHHIDLDKKNNQSSNKIYLTSSQHRTLHNLLGSYAIKLLTKKQIRIFTQKLIKSGRITPLQIGGTNEQTL